MVSNTVYWVVGVLWLILFVVAALRLWKNVHRIRQQSGDGVILLYILLMLLFPVLGPIIVLIMLPRHG